VTSHSQNVMGDPVPKGASPLKWLFANDKDVGWSKCLGACPNDHSLRDMHLYHHRRSVRLSYRLETRSDLHKTVISSLTGVKIVLCWAVTGLCRARMYWGGGDGAGD